MRHTTTALLLLCCSVSQPAAAADGYQPDINRVRAALTQTRPVTRAVTSDTPTLSNAAVVPYAPSLTSRRLPPPASTNGNRDSIWNGVLIGAAAGAGGGYLWGAGQCSSNDRECFAIAGPVGVLGGAAIGALVGGIVDAMTYSRSR